MFKAALTQIQHHPGSTARLYIAYSGGIDSQVLLHLVSGWAQGENRQLSALHLNHGLSQNAARWQAFCEQQCAALGVSLSCKRIELDPGASGSLEQRARDARYDWFESVLDKNDLLLMAHHRDDQAETLLLRALRGSGTRGLAGMPESRRLGKAYLLRPFLDIPRHDIQAYAERYGLDWIDDESNASLQFDRNYLRHQVMPVLSQRWPHAASGLARSADHCRDDQVLLDALAGLDIEATRLDQPSRWLEALPPLSLPAFTRLSRARQRNLLQYLLRPLLKHPLPSDRMGEFLRQLEGASPGANIRLDAHPVRLLVYDQQLHIIHPLESHHLSESYQWATTAPFTAAHLPYQIELVEQPAGAKNKGRRVPFERGETVRVHWRQGGERIHLRAEKFSRSLKKHLQEQRVAPWLRSAMPLISVHDYIVWSATLGDLSPRLVDAKGTAYSFVLSPHARV